MCRRCPPRQFPRTDRVRLQRRPPANCGMKTHRRSRHLPPPRSDAGQSNHSAAAHRTRHRLRRTTAPNPPLSLTNASPPLPPTATMCTTVTPPDRVMRTSSLQGRTVARLTEGRPGLRGSTHTLPSRYSRQSNYRRGRDRDGPSCHPTLIAPVAPSPADGQPVATTESARALSRPTAR